MEDLTRVEIEPAYFLNYPGSVDVTSPAFVNAQYHPVGTYNIGLDGIPIILVIGVSTDGRIGYATNSGKHREFQAVSKIGEHGIRTGHATRDNISSEDFALVIKKLRLQRGLKGDTPLDEIVAKEAALIGTIMTGVKEYRI